MSPESVDVHGLWVARVSEIQNEAATTYGFARSGRELCKTIGDRKRVFWQRYAATMAAAERRMRGVE